MANKDDKSFWDQHQLELLKAWLNIKLSKQPGSQDLEHQTGILRTRVAMRNLETAKVPADGNCQFHAVRLQVEGRLDDDGDARKRAVAYLRDHEDDFAAFVDRGFGAYLDAMSRDKCWGDHVTLAALAKVYRRTIEVVLSWPEKESVMVPGTAVDASGEAQTICLCLLGELHYDALKPFGTTVTGTSGGLVGASSVADTSTRYPRPKPNFVRTSSVRTPKVDIEPAIHAPPPKPNFVRTPFVPTPKVDVEQVTALLDEILKISPGLVTSSLKVLDVLGPDSEKAVESVVKNCDLITMCYVSQELFSCDDVRAAAFIRAVAAAMKPGGILFVTSQHTMDHGGHAKELETILEGQLKLLVEAHKVNHCSFMKEKKDDDNTYGGQLNADIQIFQKVVKGVETKMLSVTEKDLEFKPKDEVPKQMFEATEAAVMGSSVATLQRKLKAFLGKKGTKNHAAKFGMFGEADLQKAYVKYLGPLRAFAYYCWLFRLLEGWKPKKLSACCFGGGPGTELLALHHLALKLQFEADVIVVDKFDMGEVLGAVKEAIKKQEDD